MPVESNQAPLTDATPLVYVVDDDEAVRKALRRLIESMGLRAEVFATPAELLSRDLSDEPDCLLLDVQLPGMNGFELHERVLGAGHAAPVIFITAHPDSGSRARAEMADAVAYLEKPFDDASLLRALEQALERANRSP
jgi:FixJ family two-component response regulator